MSWTTNQPQEQLGIGRFRARRRRSLQQEDCCFEMVDGLADMEIDSKSASDLAMSEEGTTSLILSRAEWLAQRRRQCPRRKKMTVRSATSKRRTDVQETLHLRHRPENVNVSKVICPADP